MKEKLIIAVILLASCESETDEQNAIGMITEKHYSTKPCICEYEYFYGAQLQHYEFEDSCSRYDLGDNVYNK